MESGVVDTMLECAVCLGEFQDQRMLPCQHTFCLGCLRGVHQKAPGPTISCPECRTPHTIPGDLKHFQPSVTIARLQSAAQAAQAGRGQVGSEEGHLPGQYTGLGAVQSRLARWSSPDSLQSPACVALCPVTGRLVVSDRGPDRQCVLIFRPSGSLLTSFGTRGSKEGQFDSPLGLTVSSHTNIYVCDFHNHRVQWFSALGDYLGSLSARRRDFYPTGICVTDSHEVFVTSCETNLIYHFNNNEELINTFGKHGNAPGQLDYPTDISVVDDKLIVNDLANNRIQILDYHGRSIGVIDRSKGLKIPSGITLDNQGHVLVLDNADHSVKVYENHGQYLGKISIELEDECCDICCTKDAGIVVIDTTNNQLVFL